MENDNLDLRNLREWQPVNDVFQKIPPKIQKGFFAHEVNVTCIDALPEYLALGSNVGIVFWYNRQNGNVQKLRTESTAAITCIKLVSSVEYMVAAGNSHGEVTIFQIQKELPSELASTEIAAALITSNPIERYTIKDTCRGSITCVEWSKNGMKLFSGDTNGIVVLTELDFSQHISKSIEVINEKFGINQIQSSSPWVLVSTLYRAIVCKRDEANQWKVCQIGRTDRKELNDFGAVFSPTDVDHRKPPSIICARPGFRFWLADVDGNVSHTFLLKDSISEIRSIFEVPLLNPKHTKSTGMKDAYFGPCHYYLGKFIVTHCESMVFFVHLDTLKVIATVRRLRKIQYLTVNGNEIFIVEGGRSIVRLSVADCSTSGTQYVPLNNDLMSTDANIEIQEEIVTQADECFELPPIKNIQLDVPLECRFVDHNLLKEDKLLLEHSRKLEVFEKINTLDYDDSILFQTASRKKKKSPVHSIGNEAINGIVEIGRPAEYFIDEKSNGFDKSEPPITNIVETGLFNEVTNRAHIMLASYCDGVNEQDKLSISDGKSYESQNNLTPEHASISNQRYSPKSSPKQFTPMELSYPSYSIACDLSNKWQSKLVEVPSDSMRDGKKRPQDISLSSDDESEMDAIKNLEVIKQCANNHSPAPVKPQKEAKDNTIAKHFPNLANLPKLWDIKIEKCDENQCNGDVRRNSNGSSEKEGSDDEWELL